MLKLIEIMKALIEVAGVGMLGQGVLWVLAGAKRNENVVYNIFRIITSPVMKVTRWITPRVVLDRHIWLVSIFLLSVLWLAVYAYKVKLFLERASPAAS